jgi:hypothetical protein
MNWLNEILLNDPDPTETREWDERGIDGGLYSKHPIRLASASRAITSVWLPSVFPAKPSCSAPEAGEERAAATLSRYEERLARAPAHVINLLDPDVIVLGGGVSRVERLYRTVPTLWINGCSRIELTPSSCRHCTGPPAACGAPRFSVPESSADTTVEY